MYRGLKRRSEDNLELLVLLFHHVGPRDWFYVVRLGFSLLVALPSGLHCQPDSPLLTRTADVLIPCHPLRQLCDPTRLGHHWGTSIQSSFACLELEVPLWGA